MKIEVNGNNIPVINAIWHTENATYYDRCFNKNDFEFYWIKILIDYNSLQMLDVDMLSKEVIISFNEKKAKFYVRADMLEYLAKQIKDKERQVFVIYFVGTCNEI